MARALVGYVGHAGSASEQVLTMEVARLRRRVSELEHELADLKASAASSLDLELHRIAQDAEPVLA